MLAVCATLFYVFVYTLWLKRTSRQNIVIGGAAGAVPVLVGWAAVRDSVGLGTGGAVRLDVRLDAAALLGPRHPLPRRLPIGDVPMMPAVTTFKRTAAQIWPTRCWWRRCRWCSGGPPGMGPLYWVSARACSGVVFCAHGDRAVAHPDRGGGHAAVPLVDHVRDAAVRGDGGRPADLPLTPAGSLPSGTSRPRPAEPRRPTPPAPPTPGPGTDRAGGERPVEGVGQGPRGQAPRRRRAEPLREAWTAGRPSRRGATAARYRPLAAARVTSARRVPAISSPSPAKASGGQQRRRAWPARPNRRDPSRGARATDHDERHLDHLDRRDRWRSWRRAAGAGRGASHPAA